MQSRACKRHHDDFIIMSFVDRDMYCRLRTNTLIHITIPMLLDENNIINLLCAKRRCAVMDGLIEKQLFFFVFVIIWFCEFPLQDSGRL